MDETRVREILTEHGYHPFGKSIPANPLAENKVINPYCGDELTVYLETDGSEYRFVYQGQGCAVCMASASILAATIQAGSKEELLALLQRAWTCITNKDTCEGGCECSDHACEEWEALSWFHQNPRRLACVEVSWKGAFNALGATNAG